MRWTKHLLLGLTAAPLIIGLLAQSGYAACSGYTTVSAPVMRTYQRAKSCCSGFDSFKYQDIDFGFFSGKTAKFRLGATAYAFETGKSYFSAYRLPEFETPYTIKVRSRPGGAHAPLFYPVILLLNKDYHTVFSTDETTMQDTGDSAIGGTVPVNSAEIKYMIVMTTTKALSTCSQLNYTSGTQFGDFTTSLLYAHSPMGKVTLRLVKPR